MKRYLVGLCVLALATLSVPTHAATISQRLAGRIVLQVQSHGEGWYVHPSSLQRYYLGRPADAFAVMRSTSLGITNADLARIPVSGTSSTPDSSLVSRLSGRIVLQVQSHGEAWYIYPVDGHRYYLGRPTDAFNLMRTLGIGITNADLSTIPVSSQSATPPTTTGTFTDSFDGQRSIILNDLNTQRASHQLVSLRLSSVLSQAAQSHADDMTTKQYYSLTSPDGTKAIDRAGNMGYQAQNIGIWLDEVPTGASHVVSDWMSSSPSQFASLALGSVYRDVGVGVGTVHGKSVYVVLLGLSQQEYFQNQTAGLADMTKVRNDMLARVNQERQTAGLAPIVMNDRLTAAAQGHTDDMLAQGYYSHDSLDGRTPTDRVSAAGYAYRAMGENIAKGQFSVKEVMDDWMASPGHKENILGDYKDVGFGLSFGPNKNGYEILWAQDFGKQQ